MENKVQILEIMAVRFIFTTFFVFVLALVTDVLYDLSFVFLILTIYVGLIPLTLVVYLRVKNSERLSYYMSIAYIISCIVIGTFEWYLLNNHTMANPISNLSEFVYMLPFAGFISAGVYLVKMRKRKDTFRAIPYKNRNQ